MAEAQGLTIAERLPWRLPLTTTATCVYTKSRTRKWQVVCAHESDRRRRDRWSQRLPKPLALNSRTVVAPASQAEHERDGHVGPRPPAIIMKLLLFPFVETPTSVVCCSVFVHECRTWRCMTCFVLGLRLRAAEYASNKRAIHVKSRRRR